MGTNCTLANAYEITAILVLPLRHTLLVLPVVVLHQELHVQDAMVLVIARHVEVVVKYMIMVLQA